MGLMEQRVTIRLTISGPDETTLILEPWGEIHLVPPNSTLEIVGKGPEGDTLEIERAEDSLVVYGWPGSVVNVYLDGTEIDSRGEHRPRAPGFDALPRKDPPATAHRRRRAKSGAS